MGDNICESVSEKGSYPEGTMNSYNSIAKSNLIKKWAENLSIFLKKTHRQSKATWKGYSTSLIIREMQIATTVRDHLPPVRMTVIRKRRNECRWGSGEKGALVRCWWKCKLVQPLCKRMEGSQKIKNRTMIWSSNPTSRYLYKGNENTSRKRSVCTPASSLQHLHNTQDMETTPGSTDR